MTLFIYICLAAFFWLLWLLRRNRVSFGLPIAYLFSLLLIHVPGGLAHVAAGGSLSDSDLTEVSMRFAAIGSICFVVGVWLARLSSQKMPIYEATDRHRFWLFCLAGGWFFTYGISFLNKIPSFGAAISKGEPIWMLGVLLGLRAACRRVDHLRIGLWLGALMVYPVLMLLLGGFLSYGSAAIIVVLAVLTISTRSYWRVATGIAIFTFFSLSAFVTYFQHRNDIRDQVWGGAPLATRIESVIDTVKDFEWLDLTDQTHLTALDERLNQNYFAGLAARRIELGQVDYLRGASIWEGLIALVPRAVWPEKPVFAGSPEIVSRMTGLQLSPTTSFGVGNVMEFQINFGIPGLIFGFLLLGWLIGTLDFKAAAAERRGDLGKVIIYFLPCVALIQPNGSLVELFGGSAAALVGAVGWNLAWKQLAKQSAKKRSIARLRLANHRESFPFGNEPAS